ncbi:MAG: MBL fold metallo-hydrolase RNA specificity domain-containing protein [Acidimicrobiales bacterium]
MTSDTPTEPPPTRPDVPVLTFLGAAGTVTGSRFLVDTPTARVLVDCGMFQGLKSLRLRNWAGFPVDPATIDAVVVTHAHVDHVGYLPALVRDGFRGRVVATPGTCQLAAIVLPDSGRLQEEEAAFANRKGYSKHHPARALFTEADAERAVRSMRSVPFHRPTEVALGVEVTFAPAGHILGSGTARLVLDDGGDGDVRTVVFSGDLGRPDHPLLVPPDPIGEADIVVMESTYGNRRHDDADAIERFADAITRTATRGGMILVPAFAVDRTEVVIHHLHRLMDAGTIPRLSVYVDSPMALAALSVYREAVASGAPDVRPDVVGRGTTIDGDHLVEAHSVDESKALADLRVPSIIVSASGMASGGRVVHHLHRLLPSPLNTVVLAGFQAPGTRGRALADGATEVKMLGHHVPVRAEIVDIPAFSVHADQDELCGWLATATTPPDTVYLVHGEPAAAETLRDRVHADLGFTTVVAADGERVRLDRPM